MTNATYLLPGHLIATIVLSNSTMIKPRQRSTNLVSSLIGSKIIDRIELSNSGKRGFAKQRKKGSNTKVKDGEQDNGEEVKSSSYLI